MSSKFNIGDKVLVRQISYGSTGFDLKGEIVGTDIVSTNFNVHRYRVYFNKTETGLLKSSTRWISEHYITLDVKEIRNNKLIELGI